MTVEVKPRERTSRLGEKRVRAPPGQDCQVSADEASRAATGHVDPPF